MEHRFGVSSVQLTTSCTTALEVAAILCELGPDDEVILPSYTFVSTAGAFHVRGATIRFADVRPDTLNLDESQLSQLITDRTRVVVPVHYAGVACDMDRIREIARPRDILVVEDAAQGVNARYKGRYLGTIGDIGTYSFHETKNYTCGEGGALVTNDSGLAERAEVIREKGTNRKQFFRGQVDKYTWVDVGSSYVISDLLAAFLFAQIEHMDEILERRKSIYWAYHAALLPLQDRGIVRLPTIPDGCDSNYHMFYVLLRDATRRPALIEYLKARGITAVFHYVPLHTSPMGRKLGYTDGMLPVTEKVAEQLVRLPMYYELTTEQITRVVSAVYKFFGVEHRLA